MTNLLPAQALVMPMAQGLISNANLDNTTLNFMLSAMPAGVGFTRASSATDFATTGLLTTEGVNVPRFDTHPTTLQPRGLLVESSRTNLLLNSATLSTQSISVTAVPHVLSFYGTGSVTLSGAATGTLNGTGAFPNRAVLTFTPSAGSLTLTVTGTVEFAQCGPGTFPTSYIPTTTAAATRASDYPRVAELNTLNFNPNEGTLLIEFEKNFVPQAAVFPCAAGFFGTGVSMQIYNAPNTTTLNLQVSGGIDTPLPGSFSLSAPNKVAFAYQNANFAACLNGGALLTNTVAALPSGFTRLDIGTQLGGSNQFNGWIRRLEYSPVRLNNARLQTLTQ